VYPSLMDTKYDGGCDTRPMIHHVSPSTTINGCSTWQCLVCTGNSHIFTFLHFAYVACMRKSDHNEPHCDTFRIFFVYDTILLASSSTLSLLLNLPATQTNRLQLVLNSVARAVTKTPKFLHITPILKSLHWLKINDRIKYKVLSHI